MYSFSDACMYLHMYTTTTKQSRVHTRALHSLSRTHTCTGNIVEPPVIKRIYCGKKHTLAVDEDGGIWSWGNNGYGRLGLNDPHDRKRPCKVHA